MALTIGMECKHKWSDIGSFAEPNFYGITPRKLKIITLRKLILLHGTLF